MKRGQRKHITTNAKTIIQYDGMGMSVGEAWARQCCKYYLETPPIAHYLTYPPTHPDFNPDDPDAPMTGTGGKLMPDLSINGGRTDFDMRLGAVYMNRTLMRAAWEDVTGHGGNVAADGRDLLSHPMRYAINQRRDQGILKPNARDEWFFDLDYLRGLNLDAAANTHLERKELWGDRYDAGSSRSIGRSKWDEVMQRIERCRIVDFATVSMIADRAGLANPRGTAAARKLKEWCEWRTVQIGKAETVIAPKLMMVYKGVYRVLKWDNWSDMPLEADAIPMAKWSHELIRMFARRQHKDPTESFTIQAVLEYLDPDNPLYSMEDSARGVIWNERFRPEGWGEVYVGSQLSRLSNRENCPEHKYKPDRLFVRTKKGRYQIDHTVLKKWFEFDLMTDGTHEVDQLAMAIYDLGGEDTPFWFVQEDIPYLIANDHSRESWFSFFTALKKRGWLETKRSAYPNEHFVKKQVGPGYMEAPIYILSRSCLGDLGVRFNYEPEEYVIPRYDDGVPKRNITPPWTRTEEYAEAVDYILRWYDDDFMLPDPPKKEAPVNPTDKIPLTE